MAEIAPQQRLGTGLRRVGRVARRQEEPSVAQTGAVLFPQLVWAHYQWERKLHADGQPDEGLEQAYQAKLAEFQKQQGRLEQVYWSTRSASAVAMTVRRGRAARRDPLRLREREDVIRLHRVTDWIVRDAPRVAELLHECDLLAIRVSEVLRGTSEQIAMRWILGIQIHLLGFFEREAPASDERAEAELVRTQRRKLAEVETYYQRAASQAGRMVYVTGMLIGMFMATVLAVLGGFLLWAAGLSHHHRALLLICFGAGAVGALVSAISRMGKPERGKFNIDFELGRPLVRRLGVYRPFVGAIFGVALYFLLASGLLDLKLGKTQDAFYYGFAAFLAGFSERFATGMLGAASARLVPGQSGEGSPPAGAGGDKTS